MAILQIYYTLHNSSMPPLQSTTLCINLPWLYFTLLDCTKFYHGSTSFYFTLLQSTMYLFQSF